MDGLIVSVAYQYLLNQGWNKKVFWEYENKKNIGVDIAIRRTFYPATHGARSRVMSVAEKYVWCAKHRIEAWMTNGDVPRFSVWLGDNQGEEILYAYTSIINEPAGIEETIWISSGVVKNDEFDNFIKQLNIYWESRCDLLNVSDFRASQYCRCYCTPQEACTVHSHKEVGNTETTFALPSRLVRELTGIVYGDGYQYLNKEGEQIGRYMRVGENWKNQQKCLQMDARVLNESLEENQYKMFWLFRVYRSPSDKAYEAFDREIMHSTDRSFVIWLAGDEYKYVELQNIEPPRTEMNEYELLITTLYSDAEE